MPRTLITGCSSGIGRALSAELGRRGHEVIATARRLDSIQDVTVAQRLALDVTDAASVARAAATVGEVDVVVNNAGILLQGPVELVSLDAVERAFDTNVFGVLRMMQAFLPGMRERGRGRIVNLSSISAPIAYQMSGMYGASKRALEAISESLALEVGHLGIHISIVRLPAVDSSLNANAMGTALTVGAYREIAEQRNRLNAKRQRAAMSVEVAAAAVADVIDAAAPSFSYAVGDFANGLIERRRAQSDDEYLATYVARHQREIGAAGQAD